MDLFQSFSMLGFCFIFCGYSRALFECKVVDLWAGSSVHAAFQSLTCILSLRTTLCQLILGHIAAVLFIHLTPERSVGMTSLPAAQGCLKN